VKYSSIQPLLLPTSFVLFVPSVILIAWAIDRNAGGYDTRALGCILIAGLFSVLAVALSSLEGDRRQVIRIFRILMALAVVVDFYFGLRGVPIHPLLWREGPEFHTTFFYGVMGLAAALAATVIIGWRPLVIWTF